jgi:hypothetical protein
MMKLKCNTRDTKRKLQDELVVCTPHQEEIMEQRLTKWTTRVIHTVTNAYKILAKETQSRETTKEDLDVMSELSCVQGAYGRGQRPVVLLKIV